jgi:hypothetical protein
MFININLLININYFIIYFFVAPKLLPEPSEQLSNLRETFPVSSCQHIDNSRNILMSSHP